MAKFAVICLPPVGAAGSRTPITKTLCPLNGRPVWLYSAERSSIATTWSGDRRDLAGRSRILQFKFSSNVTILGIDVVEGEPNVDLSPTLARSSRRPVFAYDAASPAWPTNGSTGLAAQQTGAIAIP